MVNPDLKTDAIADFYRYTRARAAFIPVHNREAFEAAAAGAPLLDTVFVVGSGSFTASLADASPVTDTFPSHRDDAAIWLFSGGTTGQPKAVVQTHRSFANTTECYGKGVLGLTPTTSPCRCPSCSSATPRAPICSSRSRSARPRVVSRAVHGRPALRQDRDVPAHRPGQRAHDGPQDAGPRNGGHAGSLVAAGRHLRGRGAAGGAPPPMERALGRRPAGRPRHRGDVAHLHLQPSR